MLLPNAVTYLNITTSGCFSAPVPNGRVLKTHHYYSKRPYQTYMYGEFDANTWTAHIGMGNETQGTALAGMSHHLKSTPRTASLLSDLPVQTVLF